MLLIILIKLILLLDNWLKLIVDFHPNSNRKTGKARVIVKNKAAAIKLANHH